MKFRWGHGRLCCWRAFQSMPSAAQSVVAQTVGAQAANDSTPTVTIINKSTEAPRETALPELKVSPAVETPSVTPAQTRADTRADVPAGAAAPVTVAAPAPANPNASVVTPAA